MELTKYQSIFRKAIAGDLQAGESFRIDIQAETTDAKQRLDIYRNNATQILVAVLSDVYPACRALVGEKFFEQTARSFAVDFRPGHNLNFYGKEFPEFLANLPGLSEYPFMKDVAQFEWVKHDFFWAAGDDDSEVAGPNPQTIFEKLTRHSPDEITFRLRRPGVVFRSDFPVRQIYKAARKESKNKDSKNNGTDDIVLDETGDRLFIVRLSHTLEIHEITDLQSQILSACYNGQSVAELDHYFDGLSAEQISTEFVFMIQAGWILDIQPIGK